MYKMYWDYISPYHILSFCYERHAFPVEPGKAVKGSAHLSVLMYFTKAIPYQCTTTSTITTALFTSVLQCVLRSLRHSDIELFGQNKSQKETLWDTQNLVQTTGEEDSLSPALMQANQRRLCKLAPDNRWVHVWLAVLKEAGTPAGNREVICFSSRPPHQAVWWDERLSLLER